jgi:hypothetical protein
MMEAVCANPHFYAGVWLAIGAAGGFAAAMLFFLPRCEDED